MKSLERRRRRLSRRSVERRRGRGTGEERELATLATMVPSLRGSGAGAGTLDQVGAS